MKSVAIALMVLLGISAPSFAQKQTVCARVKVSDGDTITCDNLKIRFCGIDAPETKQPLGPNSKQKLFDLLKGKIVLITPIETDRYGRTVAEVWTKGNNLTINAQMVRDGMAYHYSQYSKNCPNRSQIVDSERQAQIDKLGVWSSPTNEKPWDYRKRIRQSR